MASLGGLNLNEGGGENEEELAGFLETMMGQLMSKEILYDPLKELSEKVDSKLLLPWTSADPLSLSLKVSSISGQPPRTHRTSRQSAI
jgi:peroxin-19